MQKEVDAMRVLSLTNDSIGLTLDKVVSTYIDATHKEV